MVDDDLALEEDLGDATIVFEGPDDDPEELTVPNEHVAYFQDHWLVKTDEEEDGPDLVRRIPATRVYHVERSVEEFESEIKTLRDRVESVAEELRTKIPGGDRSGSRGGGRGAGGRRRETEAEPEPHTIDVERGGESDRDGDD